MSHFRGVLAVLVGVIASVGALSAAPTEASSHTSESCGGQPCTWNFEQIDVPAAQPLGDHGSGVTVAVVDTWVDYAHPDLERSIVGHAYCVDGGGTCRANTSGADQCTHGTHVAGTVASDGYGIAPRSSILAIQVLSYQPSSGSCSGSFDDVAAGIRYATAQGVEVINLSLGALMPKVFQSQVVTEAVRDAARHDIVVVFAAGNSGTPFSDDYGSDALLVAATNPNGRIASYSAYGNTIPFAAPGGEAGGMGASSCTESNCVLSTEPYGEYGLQQGTSMAAPHVSGTVALLIAQNPARGREDVVTALRETARQVNGVKYGEINSAAALEYEAAPSRTTRSTGNGPSEPSTATTTNPPDRTTRTQAAGSNRGQASSVPRRAETRVVMPEKMGQRVSTYPPASEAPTASTTELAPDRSRIFGGESPGRQSTLGGSEDNNLRGLVIALLIAALTFVVVVVSGAARHLSHRRATNGAEDDLDGR